MSDFKINNGTLEWCSGAEGDVVIPHGVTEIGSEAFARQFNLTSITIPDGVTKIGKKAFYWCESLAYISLPSGLRQINVEAFKDCKKLMSVNLPEGLKRIGSFAFHCCINLTRITIPEGLTEIGEGAFSQCTNLTSITLPASLKKIGAGAFRYTNLKQLNISQENKYYRIENGCLISRDGVLLFVIDIIGDVSVPSGVTKIGEGAFIECENVKSISIPDGVTEIGKNAFFECKNLTSISVPDSLETYIGDPFKGCEKLHTIFWNSMGFLTLKPNLKQAAVNGFVRRYKENMEIPEEIRAAYLKYIRGQRKKLYETALNNEDLMYLMTKEKIIPKADIDDLVKKSGERENSRIEAMLLEYSDR